MHLYIYQIIGEEREDDENNSYKPIFVNNIPKISEMKEGVEYIEKGTGSTVKIHKLKEDKDGAAKEKDNKENI